MLTTKWARRNYFKNIMSAYIASHLSSGRVHPLTEIDSSSLIPLLLERYSLFSKEEQNEFTKLFSSLSRMDKPDPNSEAMSPLSVDDSAVEPVSPYLSMFYINSIIS